MATNTKLPPPASSNHVITAKGIVGGNRKKQKRRAKAAAAKTAPHSHLPPTPGAMPPDMDYDEDPLGYGDEDEFDYSDEAYNDHYASAHAGANGYDLPPEADKKKSKKKKTSSLHPHSPYNPELLGNDLPPMPNPPPPPAASMQRMHRPGRKETIWNTSSAEERQNIKDFWLSLTEEQRKSLLKIEKDAVLRKMKQQQKHSCSCTVCGRKRTAIEEELEVLYEGYYEELEQYAHHDHPPFQSADGMVPDPLQHRSPHPLRVPPPQPPPHHHHHHHHHHHSHRTSHVQEHFDDDEFSEDEEEEEYSDEEYSDDEDAEEIPRSNIPNDFFNFGQNLTVKDNLLTVADDLLKNDGRKFIEMMEQLAERRMHREETAEYAAANPSHPGAYPPGDHYNHEDPLAADEFDDDEASYDSQEDYDEDYDDMEDPAMDEEERVREGRRMFQIFAARMFEQRVLTAYKEKVAQERQQKLLEELEDETKKEAQREEKKQRDAQKKKDKKKQQKQAKDEAKAKQDAEKAAEEARVREAEEKKQEEQRRKKEEQRRKKDEEKKKVDEERAKKDAEKLRRQQEEQQRREEAERKTREQKAKKDEAKKREREEREAREKEARERKAQEEREKREREAKAKAEKEAKEREKATQQAAQPPIQPQQIQKRPSQPGMVAVPGVYPKQTGSGISSPHPSIATPSIPKAPTPAKQRQASQQGSLASSPKQSTSQVSSVPSKSSSPNSAAASQPQAAQPKAILQKAGNQQPNPPQSQQPMQSTSPNLHQPIQPPPGMPHPQQHFMPPMGFPGFQGPMHQQMHMGQRGSMPIYPPQHGGPPMGMQNRFGHPPVNGMPPGFIPPQQQGRGMGYPPFDMHGAGQPPPGFGPPQQSQTQQVTPPIGPPTTSGAELPRPMVSHSRQHSASEKERFESAANQPIARPAPIQRPSSVKPHSQERRGSNTDLDDLSRHLGSSALLDDSDEALSGNLVENRRQSNLQPGNRTSQAGGMAPIGGFGPPGSGFGGPGSWNNAPFGQSPGLGQHFGAPGMNMNGFYTNNAAFAANSFGSLPRPGGPGSLNRPLTIRLAVCQACKQLTQANRGEGDGFHDVAILLRQIEANRPNLDAPPTLKEIEDICETEGDAQNGGGVFSWRGEGESMVVKWAPDATTPDQGRGLAGLGEIGSPMPSKTSPSFGAPGSRAPGAPGFASLGTGGF